ncbi:16S rRNA (guanine(966)-N(2))-methyltransferase RsmD [uncultured Psychrobacter sp.]|uniref:16S rRNA (guanine(966)-N(2))-methyltransferase RsmD n=1 Tax=uncultured Psychrobacter sp. TaxID=259303 RepID=UPI0034591447
MKKTSDKSKAKPTVTSSVRIIGGQFKRRSIAFIDADGLRPTPDRLRETLFNWLLADIYDACVLDSCAGSGVLGFEALSRGAAHCTFIEINNVQSKLLAQSAEQLQIESNDYQIIGGAAEQVLNQKGGFEQPFDIVFIDPPYAQNLWQPILSALINNHLITADTLIYLESDKDLSERLDDLTARLNEKVKTQNLTRFECLKQTKVGQVVAGLYRLTSS